MAAIEAHRASHARYRDALSAAETAPGAASRSELDRLHAAVDAAAWALLEVRPVSPEGLMALATYAGDVVAAGNEWPAGWDQRFYAVIVRWPDD
ncbi:hypothetical protein [Rhodoplanes roseus]|nr:hypothetical protein [Rhodoplanes roseus]